MFGLGGLSVGFADFKPPVVFDPTTLSLSAYWRANFPGSSPWNATATAGVSSTTGALNHGLADCTSGGSQNGWTPCAFNGSQDMLNTTDVINGGIWTKIAGTIFCVFKSSLSGSTPTGNIFDDAALFSDSNYDTGLTFSSSGVQGFIYSSGYVATGWATASSSNYHLAMVRWNSTHLGITVDSASEITVSVGAATVMTGTPVVGYGSGGTHNITGNILEVGAAEYSFANTDYSNLKSYVNSRYALSL